MSYDSFLAQFDEEDEDETIARVADIKCTPMTDVGLKQMRGEEIDDEELRKAADALEQRRATLLALFDKKLRTYVGGVRSEKGHWEFGLCADEEDVAKMSARAGDYAEIVKKWCADRNVSRASTEPRSEQKLDCFFEMLVDMGLDDIDELREEDYSCRVIIKALQKLNMYRLVSSSGWDAKRPFIHVASQLNKT
eukprot:g3042.t1